MEAKEWIKEIEEAKKKLYEYRCVDPYYCYMPFSFLEAIMTKLMKSIPISWIENYIKDNTSTTVNPKYVDYQFTEEPFDYHLTITPFQVSLMLRKWREGHDIVCGSGVPDPDRSGTADSGTAEFPE